MVSVNPLYDLRAIQDLATDGEIDFSRKAARDFAELGYGPEQVADCIRWLTPDEFDKRVCYSGVWYDAYVTPHYSGPARPKKIYVKLRITSDGRLFVTSFHTERPFD